MRAKATGQWVTRRGIPDESGEGMEWRPIHAIDKVVPGA